MQKSNSIFVHLIESRNLCHWGETELQIHLFHRSNRAYLLIHHDRDFVFISHGPHPRFLPFLV